MAAVERQEQNRVGTEAVGSAKTKFFAVRPYGESVLISGDVTIMRMMTGRRITLGFVLSHTFSPPETSPCITVYDVSLTMRCPLSAERETEATEREDTCLRSHGDSVADEYFE